MRKWIRFMAPAAIALLAAVPAIAGDMRYGYTPYGGPEGFQPGGLFYTEQRDVALPNETITLRGSIGAMYLRGDEYVFNGDRILSQLIWESRVPVARAGADIALGSGFSVSASGAVAGLGSSYMEDYDWVASTSNFDDWTHRSQHPDTSLDHYVSFEAAGGYEVARTDTAVVRALAGVKYTDMKWSARGGTYIYSVNGFRDTIGSLPDGVVGDYRQQLPEVFVGVDGEERYGKLTIGGMLRGGITAWGRSTDNHFLRDLVIEDQFGVSPTLSAGLDVGYELGPLANLFVSARYDQSMMLRGRSEYRDTTTGALTIAGDDLGGAEMRSLSLSAGLKGRF